MATGHCKYFHVMYATLKRLGLNERVLVKTRVTGIFWVISKMANESGDQWYLQWYLQALAILLFSDGPNVTNLYESWLMVARLTTMQVIQDVTLNQFTNLLVPGNQKKYRMQSVCRVCKGFWLPQAFIVSWNPHKAPSDYKMMLFLLLFSNINSFYLYFCKVNNFLW